MARRRYLVMYDIADESRLRQVAKVVKGFGQSLQYSVYVCDHNKRELIELRWLVGEAMDHRADSVVLVRVGDAGQARDDAFEFLGVRPTLPSRAPTVL